MQKQIIYRIIDTVEMSFRIRTALRIAVHLFTLTQLLLCRDHHRLCLITMFHQKLDRLARHISGDRFCREIKNLIRQIFPHCAHCRKYRGDCLADSGRSLDKQILLAPDRSVNI